MTAGRSLLHVGATFRSSVVTIFVVRNHCSDKKYGYYLFITIITDKTYTEVLLFSHGILFAKSAK